MAALARLYQHHPSAVIRLPLSNLGLKRDTSLSCGGVLGQRVPIDFDTSEVIFRNSRGYRGHLEVTDDPHEVRPEAFDALEPPAFCLSEGTQEWLWVPESHTTVFDGVHCRREWLWGRFTDSEEDPERHWSLHVEVDHFEGFSVYDVLFGNTLRAPDDRDGKRTDGDLFYESLEVRVAHRGVGVLMEHDLAWQARSPAGAYLVSPGNRFLQARRKLEMRFALHDANHAREARAALDFHDRPRVLGGPATFLDRGGYGPERSFLADMGYGNYYRHQGSRGWYAVDERAGREKAREKSRIEGSIYTLAARGSNEGNDPGGLDIQVNLSHFQHPDWWSAVQIISEMYGNRHPEMVHHLTGEPLTIHDVAEAFGCQQPWRVKRTNGSENNSVNSIPWPGDVGLPWNDGSSEEESYQRSKKDIDHAHSIRLCHPLKTRIWMLNSEMAKHLMRGLCAHYQFDPTLYRSDGNSIPRLKAAADEQPGFGDGALGRQIGWPVHIYACAKMVSNQDWWRREQQWENDLGEAVDALVSPAGGTRRREAPNWGWASPPPGLPDSSDLVCDQTFEARYVALGAHSIARTLNARSPWSHVFHRIVYGLHFGQDKPLWAKFFAYADRTEPKPFEELVNVDDGSSGNPHHGTLCERGYRWFRANQYRDNAFKWMGNPTGEDEWYIEQSLTLKDPWQGSFQDWTHTTLTWTLDMVAVLQQRLRSTLADDVF